MFSNCSVLVIGVGCLCFLIYLMVFLCFLWDCFMVCLVSLSSISMGILIRHFFASDSLFKLLFFLDTGCIGV